MIFGAISNSWKQHLADHSLTALVDEALRRGAGHVELRQTCLGEYESGRGDDWRPVISRLKDLADAFAGLPFNLAVAWPCLTRESHAPREQFRAALDAARAVGRERPHLRIVDPARFDRAWETEDQIPPEVVNTVAGLAREAAASGVILSMENSGQPIHSMALLVRMARCLLSAREGADLGLCPDPVNQILRCPDSDPLRDLEALPPDMIKMAHFKQTRGGNPWPSVDAGDLDCARQLRILKAKGYAGPAIMEIPSHQKVFDNLSASFAFLRAASGDA